MLTKSVILLSGKGEGVTPPTTPFLSSLSTRSLRIERTIEATRTLTHSWHSRYKFLRDFLIDQSFNFIE